MKPVTERDVARLMQGAIDDPVEARRIIDAIDTNPTLAQLADLLSEDDDEDDDEPTPLVHSLPNLTRTRLCRLRSPITELHSGNSGSSVVEYERDGQLSTFDLN